jgi:hypothetical protein
VQETTTFTPPSNPLAMFMRQPKIYMKLPSGGKFWPAGSIDLSDTGGLPVYSMTAKDELLLNVPDALMNGQAVVDIIQNCIPAVKNAWLAPTLDLDAMLIAIRIATYGEIMKTPVKFNNDIEMDYQVDLRNVLDSLMSGAKWEEIVQISDQMTIFVRPLTYKQASKAALQTFETQKIIQLANNESISEDNKLKMFKDSFNKLTDSTLTTVTDSISRIDSSQGSVNNPEFIKEFIANADKEIFNKLQAHLEKMKETNSIKPVSVPVTDEMRSQGITGDTVDIPLVFDASTFFA